eukprot:Gb_26805 [translate_table: standard]
MLKPTCLIYVNIANAIAQCLVNVELVVGLINPIHPKMGNLEVAIWSFFDPKNFKFEGIVGFIDGARSLDSSGISSSAAVGVAYLLAIENANDLNVSWSENIELDRNLEEENNGQLSLQNNQG